MGLDFWRRLKTGAWPDWITWLFHLVMTAAAAILDRDAGLLTAGFYVGREFAQWVAEQRGPWIWRWAPPSRDHLLDAAGPALVVVILLLTG